VIVIRGAEVTVTVDVAVVTLPAMSVVCSVIEFDPLLNVTLQVKPVPRTCAAIPSQVTP
jgi:hypothetical protein